MAKDRPQKLLKFKIENIDVYNLLCDKDNYSQYICDAVRFYEMYSQSITEGIKSDSNTDIFKDIHDKLLQIEDAINNISSAASRNKIVVDKQLINQILNEDD